MNQLLLAFFIVMGTYQSFAQDLTLDEYLSKLKGQSLDLKIEQSKLEAIDAKATGISIPPPMVGFSKMNDEDGSSANGFEVSQMIPFPTKLSADYSARKFDYQAGKKNNLSTKKQIYLNAKILFLKLWESQQQLSFLEEKRAVLQNHVKLARAVTRSDSFATVHLLKTESDLDFLENEMETVNQLIRERQFEAAVYVSVDPLSFKYKAIEPKTSQVPNIESIEESNLFQAKLLGLESLKAKERRAKSEWLPDFSLRYREMGSTRTSMESNEVMVGVTLPFVFFWQPYSVANQASKERMIGEFELEKEKRNFGSEKIVLLSRIESLKKQLDTLENKLIPKASKRMRLAHNIVPRDMETLEDHRETMEAFPELKMKALSIRIEYEVAVAALEKYSNKDKDLQNE